MSKATGVQATLIERDDDGHLSKLNGTPGAFCYVKDGDGLEIGIIHSCPCGCGQLSSAYFEPSKSKVLWTRGGTRERLTLSPSIGMRPQKGQADVESDGYHWHGHLVDGIWRSC